MNKRGGGGGAGGAAPTLSSLRKPGQWLLFYTREQAMSPLTPPRFCRSPEP